MYILHPKTVPYYNACQEKCAKAEFKIKFNIIWSRDQDSHLDFSPVPLLAPGLRTRAPIEPFWPLRTLFFAESDLALTCLGWNTDPAPETDWYKHQLEKTDLHVI